MKLSQALPIPILLFLLLLIHPYRAESIELDQVYMQSCVEPYLGQARTEGITKQLLVVCLARELFKQEQFQGQDLGDVFEKSAQCFGERLEEVHYDLAGALAYVSCLQLAESAPDLHRNLKLPFSEVSALKDVALCNLKELKGHQNPLAGRIALQACDRKNQGGLEASLHYLKWMQGQSNPAHDLLKATFDSKALLQWLQEAQTTDLTKEFLKPVSPATP